MTQHDDLASDISHEHDITHEQAYLVRLYQRLDAMRDYAQQRLRTVLLESGGTPQARSERESFTQLYTDDLAKYDAAEHGLCFGRIDLYDAEDAHREERRYIGRLGILDEDDDYATLLLDWRAPLARPFYLATTARPEGVTRRRHLRTRNRTVTAIADEYLDVTTAPPAQSGSATSGVGTESALLAALATARTGHLTDIVETIQREQDSIIRSEHKSVLVVQGGPGTGKTAVALHRAAYLLYTYRRQLDKSGVLIIGPNATFLDYIGQVLPTLGETGVLLSTIGDLYPGVHATGEDSPRATQLKGSLDMVAVLKNAVRDYQATGDTPIRLHLEGSELTLTRAIVTKARGRARSSRRPHNLARPVFATAIVDALTAQLADKLGGDVASEEPTSLLTPSDITEIRHELQADEDVQRAITALWPTLSPQHVLADLWADPQRLTYAASELSAADRAALARPGGDHHEGQFSPADAPLLDELAELLGVDDAAARLQARRRWHAQLAQAQEALDVLTGSAPQDLEDEVDPEILMAYDVIDAEQLAQRHSHGTGQTTAERAAGDRTWTYGHVIVDEAQELSPMAWRMIMRRIPNRWMTVVGDIAQTGDPAGATSWHSVLQPYVADRWQLRELSVNYRTPAEIMALAGDVLAAIDPDAQVPRSVRASGVAPTALRVTEGAHRGRWHWADPATPHAEMAAAVAELAAAEDEQPGITAVLVPQALAGDFAPLARDAVAVLTVPAAKGLEFDAVILVQPQAILDESPRGYSNLYVALTRATQRLTVVHTGQLPAVLARLNSVDHVPAGR